MLRYIPKNRRKVLLPGSVVIRLTPGRQGDPLTWLTKPIGACLSQHLPRWCERRDSNSHAFRRWILNPGCLPFHHSRRNFDGRTGQV